MPKNPLVYAVVVVLGCALVGWLLGDAIGAKLVENRREWERFEASHGGCWRTGGYDTIESVQPVYSVNGQGHLYILTWTPTTDYVYHWVCQDGTTFKR